MSWDLELERKTLALGFTHPKNKKGRWWSDPVHKPLCAWFQQQALEWLATRGTANRRKYLAILIPRACAKSLLITRAGMLWLHLQDPNLSTYIGNEKLELAEDFLRTIKRWLEGNTDEYSLFNWLYGTWKGDNNRWRSDTITHAARTQERSEASFGIWSPNAALTGRHPDIVCMDDLVSYDALKKDVNWYEYAYSHMTDLIPVVEGNGLVILVGTRYSDADPFGRSFKSDGIRSLAGHTEFQEYQTTQGGRWDVYFLSGRDKAGDKPAIPTVWPEDEMRLYEMRDPIKFASQVLNRPRAHKLRPLVEEQFDSMVVTTPIEQLPKMTISFHGDTAFKSQRRVAGGSESALVVIGHHDNEPGVCTVLDAISGINFRAETYADMVIDQFKLWSARFPVIAYTDEAEMAGKAGLWQQYLSDRFTDIGLELPTFYTFQRHIGEKKEIRIADAIHFVVNGQVKFHHAATNLSALRYQLCNHPNAYPNDLADCFADTFNPEFFSGLLPKLRADKEEYPFGAWEQHLKPRMMAYGDTMDNDEYDRHKDLMNTKLLCWDLEILDPVSDHIGGWDAARRGDCGISALVISDSNTGRYHIYDQHNLDEAVDHLNSADLLIGYNTINFDCEVVFGVTGRYITVPQYDILAEIWKALHGRRKGYKLDDVAKATIGMEKNSNGEFATALAAKGHWGKLFDYCLNDVHLTRELFNHIQDLGWIKGADGEEIQLEKPELKDYA